VKQEADHLPKDGQIFLEEWLSYGASRVPILADAMASGDPAKRGLVLMNVAPSSSTPPAVATEKAQPSAPENRATQEPRLFDYRGRASSITLKTRP
jgi:hypothetical protein